MANEYIGLLRRYGMAQYLKHGAAAVLLILVASGLTALSLPAVGGSVANNTTGTMTDMEGNTTATVDIDCNANQVHVTAPDDYEYGLTVTVVNVSQSGTSSSTSSRTPLSGNATVEYDGTGVVYGFITNVSNGDPVLTESRRCGSLPGTDTTNATSGPSIAIDCNESIVNFTAPENVSYTAQVSSVAVSPTSSSSSTVSRSAEGNTTMSAAGGLVIAFASTDAGDEPVSAVWDCSRFGSDTQNTTAKGSCSKERRQP